MTRRKTTCEKCNAEISNSNFKRHFDTCSGPKTSTSDPKYHKRYDWVEIQKMYDDGMSMRDMQAEFGISFGTFRKAKERGVFVSRDLSTSTALWVKNNPDKHKPSEETKVKISKGMAKAHARGEAGKIRPIEKYMLKNKENVALYVIRFPSKNVIKIGITEGSLKKRFSGYGTYDVLYEKRFDGLSAATYENEILVAFKKYKCEMLKEDFWNGGHTECLDMSIENEVLDYVRKL